MSISSDGATVRRERILDMLRYIRSFMPDGLALGQVQLYMSMAHGLTYKTSQQYVYEMQMGGILMFVGGALRVHNSNFRKLMSLMAPDRDPDTGEMLSMMGLRSPTQSILDEEEDRGEEEDPKDKPEKRRRDGMGRFKKKEAEG